ncbi:MAG TPA: sugar ABC transporter ATP-binding protein [Actinomycetota bacterium]|jgi:ribose transport system ATP-binding protein|nr:sugar ABC transporter ATP-binding protein [Actinomycetota bacterium]
MTPRATKTPRKPLPRKRAPAPLLVVKGLTKRYPGVVALDGVDFDVRPGEVHCLLGQNGAGKSTLIKCVSGLVSPTAGEVKLDGEAIPTGEPSAALARGIATIYQELDLVTDLTVAANVWLGHEIRRGPLVDLGAMADATSELLERLGHQHIDVRSRVFSLSPAAQQIVSIARALSRKVRLLIMDEPSAVLDDQEIETLFDVVRRLKAEGVGVVYISHRLDEVARIGDRVTVLKDGRTVQSGISPRTSARELVRAMVGRRLDHMFPKRKPATKKVVLRVEGLTREPDVHDISFDVRAGEIVGIAGLVGSRRSEILRLIYGLDAPSSGSVKLLGENLPSGRPDVALANGLGFAPEDRKSQGLLMEWDGARNVSIADLRRFARGGLLNLRDERDEAARHLDSIQAQSGAVDKLVRELSGGNQQKVVLARWLLRSCKVLLLDEPTRGVDVGAKAEIYQVISDLAALGLGIVMVSSEFPELIGFCDRIFVLRDGRIVHEARGDKITEEKILDLCVRTEKEARR